MHLTLKAKKCIRVCLSLVPPTLWSSLLSHLFLSLDFQYADRVSSLVCLCTQLFLMSSTLKRNYFWFKIPLLEIAVLYLRSKTGCWTTGQCLNRHVLCTSSVHFLLGDKGGHCRKSHFHCKNLCIYHKKELIKMFMFNNGTKVCRRLCDFFSFFL